MISTIYVYDNRSTLAIFLLVNIIFLTNYLEKKNLNFSLNQLFSKLFLRIFVSLFPLYFLKIPFVYEFF